MGQRGISDEKTGRCGDGGLCTRRSHLLGGVFLHEGILLDALAGALVLSEGGGDELFFDEIWQRTGLHLFELGIEGDAGLLDGQDDVLHALDLDATEMLAEIFLHGFGNLHGACLPVGVAFTLDAGGAVLHERDGGLVSDSGDVLPLLLADGDGHEAANEAAAAALGQGRDGGEGDGLVSVEAGGGAVFGDELGIGLYDALSFIRDAGGGAGGVDGVESVVGVHGGGGCEFCVSLLRWGGVMLRVSGGERDGLGKVADELAFLAGGEVRMGFDVGEGGLAGGGADFDTVLHFAD